MRNTRKVWRSGTKLRAAGPIALLAALFVVVIRFIACGGSNNTPANSSTQVKTEAVQAPGGWIALDPANKVAYIGLLTVDPASGNGRVAEINLGVDPDKADPRMATIILPTPDPVSGTALDTKDGIVFAVSGQTANRDGLLFLINENSNTLIARVPFPAGSQPNKDARMWFDSTHGKLIVAACDSATCSSGNPKTGISLFDLTTRTFGPIIPANHALFIAFDAPQNLVIDAGFRDDPPGTIGIIDLSSGRTCVLSDPNLKTNAGVAFDPTTLIAVVSEGDGAVPVLNFNGLSLSTAGTSCAAQEAGTLPNSTFVLGLPHLLKGAVVNPNTHPALIGYDSPTVVLLTLPAAPVAQLSSTTSIPVVSAGIPNDPLNVVWGDPTDFQPSVAASNLGASTNYIRRLPLAGTGTPIPMLCCGGCQPATCCSVNCDDWEGMAIDPMHNLGYLRSITHGFLAQVDLATFQKDPSAISTPLPPGNCTGTATTLACSNGHGVTFFPFPQ